jgi:serine/threonine protein kinase
MKVDTILADRYQIREQLSQKAGRRTFLARDLQSQNLVIIKILRFDPDFQWDDLKLFEREASTLQNLNHPAIPKYLDYFEVEAVDMQGFALVQTYIDARSLESIVTKGRKFSEAEVIELADRVLSILAYLHQQHPPVIHRDIKPSNILLTNRSGNSIGDVYLVDFGSVQTVASKDGGTITIVGSYGYIPLEQFGGQTTTASDLYSLGMTIIYLLTGTHPAELVQVNGQVKFTAEISNRFHRWLEKITQPHLDKRFESAKSAQTALTSKHGSDGDFIHLKPANSQIELDRDREKIEIRFNSVKTRGCTYPLVSFICIWIAWMFWGYIAGGIFALAWLLFGNRMEYFEVRTVNVISIDRLQKTFRSGTFYFKNKKIKWDRSDHSNLNIDFLAYNPGYIFDKYLDETGKVMRRGEVKIAPELYMYCGAAQRSIRGFTQAELWWLGQELSDFLNTELQVIYPTPKVPPEPSSCGGC